jgi:hypothetical protein
MMLPCQIVVTLFALQMGNLRVSSLPDQASCIRGGLRGLLSNPLVCPILGICF